jgi:hypothetical protein
MTVGLMSETRAMRADIAGAPLKSLICLIALIITSDREWLFSAFRR